MEVWKCSKIVELPKIFIKMKNCKTFYESQTHPHQTKSYHFPGTKISIQRYTEIHRHLLSKSFKNVVPGRQEMGQFIFFLTPNRNMFYGKRLCQKGFLFVAGPYYFQCRPRDRERDRESSFLDVLSLEPSNL